MENVLFVAQSGIIEVQSLLLADSLKEHAPHLNLKACVPLEFGDLHFITKEIFKKLDVEIIPIKNEFNPIYPIGNKLFAVSKMPNNSNSLFLDSDLLCMKSFKGYKRTTVITTGRYDVISHLEWRNIFNLFGLEMLADFEHIRSPLICCDLDFANQWKKNALFLWQQIHNDNLSLRKIRQVDQISLTITTLQNKNVDVKQWNDNEILQSPSELYQFDKHCDNICWPDFIVLQKGWLYYKRQGVPKCEFSNPNSLAYYPEIRAKIYSILAKHPTIDRIPSWRRIYGFYFSQQPLNDNLRREYMLGVEGNQK